MAKIFCCDSKKWRKLSRKQFSALIRNHQYKKITADGLDRNACVENNGLLQWREIYREWSIKNKPLKTTLEDVIPLEVKEKLGWPQYVVKRIDLDELNKNKRPHRLGQQKSTPKAKAKRGRIAMDFRMCDQPREEKCPVDIQPQAKQTAPIPDETQSSRTIGWMKWVASVVLLLS